MVDGEIQKWHNAIKEAQEKEGIAYFVCRCGRMFIQKKGEPDVGDHKCEYLPFPTKQDALHASIMISDAVHAYVKASGKIYKPKMYSE